MSSNLLSSMNLVAWYDYDLKGYQRERQGELLRRFDERQATSTNVEATDLIRKKSIQETETEWQQQVRKKKSEDYYKSLKEVNISIHLHSTLGHFLFYSTSHSS